MIYKKLTIYALGAMLFASCSEDGGPTVEDTALARATREIENLMKTPPTGEYSVGIFYQKDAWDGDLEGVPRDVPQYNRLTGKTDEYNLSPKQTPITQPDGPIKTWTGNPVNKPTTEDINRVQQQIDACVDNHIDFIVLPAMDYEKGNNARLNDGDHKYCKLITGQRGSGGENTEGVEKPADGTYVDLKGLKYAYTINLAGNVRNSGEWKKRDADGNEINAPELNYDNRIDVEAKEDYLPGRTLDDGTLWTRMTQLETLCREIQKKFEEPDYYKVNGKNFVMLQDAHRLYAQDAQGLYEKMREWLGGNVYLVAKNGDAWCPPTRYEDFFINGHVDAITNKPMYDGMQMGQWPIHPECIYLNWEYSRDVWWNSFNGIDFIPTGQLAFNKWVKESNTRDVMIQRDEQNLRKTCAIMRAMSGRNRIMLMYSLNEYRNDSFLEPTVEDGDKYLKIIKEEFNK